MIHFFFLKYYLYLCSSILHSIYKTLCHSYVVTNRRTIAVDGIYPSNLLRKLEVMLWGVGFSLCTLTNGELRLGKTHKWQLQCFGDPNTIQPGIVTSHSSLDLLWEHFCCNIKRSDLSDRDQARSNSAD